MLAVLADAVGRAADFVRGRFTPAFAADLDFAALPAFLASFFGTDFFSAFFVFFAFFEVFFEVFLAISACFWVIRPPPNANPGSSQKASGVRSVRSGRSFRR